MEKYTLLKISNSILKRLSRTQDVDIRGSIHIFLTRILSICHKSGINKKSNERDFSFNESIDEDIAISSEVPYTLYKSFWSL